MKKAFKISMILLLFGITGSAQVAAVDYEYHKPNRDIVVFAKDGDKKKTIKETRPEAGEPFFRTDQTTVSMNLLNLDAGPVEVKIYDEEDRVLYKEIITGESSVGKRFDFSEVSDGIYTIAVKDQKGQFFKKIDKY
ncbi:T9SS type A sorting domain-containing protein [Robertkochia flava]|uniref:hypothetical protein n=1 Tax=Robertkochia flava TaxID=3447986 RepID=UPI001CCC6984|nr:hypothetical protein [Robertkochia marina]